MSSLIPSLFLVFMIALTLILLPRLNEDRQIRSDEPKRATEEIHIKPTMRK
jgi:hypothetical protein